MHETKVILYVNYTSIRKYFKKQRKKSNFIELPIEKIDNNEDTSNIENIKTKVTIT